MAHFTCDAVLFDLDGVLVDSRACVERQWSVWADRHGLERGAVLRTAHGRRAVEVVAAMAPHLDASREAAALAVAEMAETRGLPHVPGAGALLRSIPYGAWGIATSAPRAIAVARLAQAGLDQPTVIVAAEDVAHGKPDPQGYLAAARRLGVPPASCLVVEDAPAGVAAARAAGMRVVAVATTHLPSALREADACVASLADLTVVAGSKGGNGRLTVEARQRVH
jgi:mannitol-1-/sugar-/sorbitol-6-phosphatase